MGRTRLPGKTAEPEDCSQDRKGGGAWSVTFSKVISKSFHLSYRMDLNYGSIIHLHHVTSSIQVRNKWVTPRKRLAQYLVCGQVSITLSWMDPQQLFSLTLSFLLQPRIILFPILLGTINGSPWSL